MRIDLVDRERERRERKQARRKRRVKPAAPFEAAVARPRLPAGAGKRAAAERKPRPAAAEPATKPPAATPKTVRARTQAAAKAAPTPAAKRTNWRFVLVKLVAGLGLAGLAALAVHVSTAPQFFVYSATVAGSRHVSAEAIYQAAGIHEQNILWVRAKEVEEKVGRLQGIKAVRVECGLPAQVRIEVEERQPVVMWRALTQQRDWWLDEEGVVLPYHGDVNNTLFVVDSSPRELKEGDRLKPEGMVASVRQLATTLPNVGIFYYQDDRGLSFAQKGQSGEDWPVYVGTTEDLPHKIAILRTLTEYLRSQNIEPRYIDVRWADHPVYGAPHAPAIQPTG
jgi:hypothetical protein